MLIYKTKRTDMTTTAWASNKDLLHFMSRNYQSFLTTINALLLPGGPSISTPIPYVLQLHPGQPNLDFGTVSSMYELLFHSPVDENVKTGLFIEKQLCRGMFMETAEGIGDGFDFLNMDATWAEPYHCPETPSPSPSLAISETTASAEEQHQQKRHETSRTQTLLIITDWAHPEAEKLVSDSGTIQDHGTNTTLTTGQYFKNHVSDGSSVHEPSRHIRKRVQS